MGEPEVWQGIYNVDPGELWGTRNVLKNQLVNSCSPGKLTPGINGASSLFNPFSTCGKTGDSGSRRLLDRSLQRDVESLTQPWNQRSFLYSILLIETD